VQALLKPSDCAQMNANPVGTWVNNPRHDDPLGIEPVITG
jgi:hypothetical protein